MIFELTFSNQAKDFLKKCDNSLSSRIIGKVEELTTNPVPHNSVRVVGEDKTFRIRIGDYRVLYEINWAQKYLLIAKIEKRAKVYN